MNSMPPLGLGTWQITGRDCVEAVRDALEIGYRHIDTARAYGNEREVGEGLRASGVDRDEVWVTTKVWLDDLAPDRARASAEASLRDLGLDQVDLLLVHWPSRDVPLEATLEAFLELREAGRTREIGVSNFPPSQFRRALELAPVVTNQVEYHPLLGQERLREIAREHGATLTAYSPIAHGQALRDPVLGEIAEAHGRSAAQVCLRWLLDQDGVLAVPKAASHDNRVANFDLDFTLTGDERTRIDAMPKDVRVTEPSFAPDWDA